MLSRLSSYFLIVAAVIFAAVQGFAIVKHVRLQTWLTTPDYINAIKIVVALMAIIVAIRSLRREKRSSPITELLGVPLRAPRSFADTLRQVTAFSIRHPVLTPLLILSFLIIPVGLRAFEKPHGWSDFGIRDWSLIGIAEMPFTLLAIFSVIVSWRSRAKKRVASRSRSE
jgi:hypothetical protein